MPPKPSGSALDAADRLRAIDALDLVPGATDPLFEPYARLVARLLRVPASAVSFVTDDRQRFASSVGLPEPWASQGETPLELSFCKHVVLDGDTLVVADAEHDPRFAGHPAVAVLGVGAYLGVPLRAPRGESLGSICAIDSERRDWSPEDIEVLTDLAAATGAAIALRTSEHTQRAFAAAASHRLRTPITALRLELDDLDAVVATAADPRLIDVAAVRHHLDALEAVVGQLVADAPDSPRLAETAVDLGTLVAGAVGRGGSSDRVDLRPGDPVVALAEEPVLRRLVELLVAEAGASVDGRVDVVVSAEAGAPRIRFDGDVGEAHRPADGDIAALVDRLHARVVRSGKHVELLLPPHSLVTPTA